MKNGNQGDGGGRPIVEFTPEQITQLEALAAVLTKGQIADYFGISETTLRAVEERQPEVSDAYKRGRAKQCASMGYNLIQLAKKGNVAANIFYLKTQAGWKEEQADVQEIPQINITVDPRAINTTAE
jgi:hypothetical protein|tara:strand:+ start:648 stop:1028 length:381 start_codon:yes stop_codon:yes gene_type:complete